MREFKPEDTQKVKQIVGEAIKHQLMSLFNCTDVEINGDEIVIPLHYMLVTSQQLNQLANMGFTKYHIDMQTKKLIIY